jgi:DNA-binding MarR family transcriptional regulator
LRRTLHREISRRLGEETLRPFQQLLALRVVALGEVKTQAQLAERLLIDPPAACRMVTKLESDGFLERCEGSDRRCVHLETTQAAKEELAIFEQRLAEVDREVRKHITADEYATMMRVMEKLQSSFKGE